jgi:predicted small metal-binding protein
MLKRITVVILALFLATFVFGSAQDKSETAPAKKPEMTKSAKEMGPLKSISCDSPCNFCDKSRDEKELVSIAKAHVKHAHKMTLSDAKLKEMIKTE